MLIEVSSSKKHIFLLSVDNRFIGGGVLINQPAEIVLNKLALNQGKGKFWVTCCCPFSALKAFCTQIKGWKRMK